MTKLLFSKELDERLPEHEQFELPDWSQQNLPEQYVIEDDGLVAAINAALVLGQPLLLTGEPGTGKTTLAARIAWQLGLNKPLTFETKSTSVARDLFYTFDAVGRFQAAQTADANGARHPLSNLPFISFQALGKAIILTGETESDLHSRIESSQSTQGKNTSRRSVVLIDEIDKAHRDFPNDLLNEIDRMFFTIPELEGRRVEANPKVRPIVVITSNSEKNLPDPFLRRCVYYHIEFPDAIGLQKILHMRLGNSFTSGKTAEKAGSKSPTVANDAESNIAKTSANENNFIASAVRFFMDVRAEQLRKLPATAELIGWARLLLAYGAKLDEPILQFKHLSLTLPALAKNEEDLKTLSRLVSKK